MNIFRGLAAVSVAAIFQATGGLAQAVPTAMADKGGADVTQTFYMVNVRQNNEVNDVVTAIRNVVSPRDRIMLVPSQDAIVMTAPPDQIELARKLLSELDRPKRTYRLTYSVTEMDAGKRIGVQRFAMIVVSREKTLLKQGSKVPIATGDYKPASGAQETQMTYLDVGINIDASLDESVDGVTLRTKLERSSVAEETSSAGVQDPVIRQTVVEGTASLIPGKPVVLGSVDVVGSTRHLDVEVMAEAMRQEAR